ncbi:MAG TPA: cell division protein FtsL [Chloroflexota bacterium]|nr:cell division protein FtsL [Chloroflexota bacterium]
MAVAQLPNPGFRTPGSGLGPVAIPRALPRPERPSPERGPRPRELRNTVALLVAITLISVISLLYMHQAGRLATSGYQISNLQAQRDSLQRENEALEVQLSQLRALPHVEEVATQKLHMTKGDLARVQYVQLDQHQQQLAATPDSQQPS